eukprot:scaffold46611_cov59-Phaeocystis_antarctica.AAC.3
MNIPPLLSGTCTSAGFLRIQEGPSAVVTLPLPQAGGSRCGSARRGVGPESSRDAANSANGCGTEAWDNAGKVCEIAAQLAEPRAVVPRERSIHVVTPRTLRAAPHAAACQQLPVQRRAAAVLTPGSDIGKTSLVATLAVPGVVRRRTEAGPQSTRSALPRLSRTLGNASNAPLPSAPYSQKNFAARFSPPPRPPLRGGGQPFAPGARSIYSPGNSRYP